MHYYKDTENQVHYLDDASYSHLLPSGSVEITAEAATALQQPTAADMAAARIADIDARLAEIDQLSARPARQAAFALLSGSAVDRYVTDKLAALEAEAVELRAERKELAA